MFRLSRVASAVALLAGGTAVWTVPAFAQDTQRVEVTGSAIRRIDAESALPVTVLRREDIEKSGVTSTVDLLRRLSSVQGSTSESASVGGATFGFAGVSVHNLGETRTLVLLNGHRLAQFGGQALTGFAAAIDLNSIPVSAIERVEVLQDGASALYGADAVAGVVNFITKRDTTDGDATIGYSAPRDGAKEKRISVTKGFGSLANDGFNIVATLAHDERTKLDSVDRSFASSGRVVFSQNGKTYRFQQYSASTIPANVTDKDDPDNKLINPYLIANGECAPNSFRVTDPDAGDFCGFDFVSTLEIYPERKRDSAFITGSKMLGDHELFADVLWSRTTQISRIAPVPGALSIPAGSDLFNTYLAPLGYTEDATAFYRLYDAGKRTDSDAAKFYDVALGSRGVVAGWDYAATYTHSESDVKGNISGYPGALALARLRSSGLLNPFVLPGQQTPEAQAAIAGAIYSGPWDGGVSKLDTLSFRGSKGIFKLAGGDLSFAAGANFNKEKFQSKPSLFAQGLLADPVAGTLCDPNNPDLPCDQRFGDAAAIVPYAADRKSYGIFGEVIAPVLKQLELGASVRYDHYSDFGSATTGKATFKWNPLPNLLFRGSIGNGFHAPSVPQVKAAFQSFGVTSDTYTCTPELQAIATSLGAQCRPGAQQYDVLSGGNESLKPEKSRQATVGFRVDPIPELSIGADLWHVEIRDSFGQLTEQTIFGNPAAYPGAFTTQTDIGTGTKYVALNLANLNLGKSFSTGIDFDITGRLKTAIGDITAQANLTYMLREESQLEPNGPYFSAIGQNSADLGTVTFRWQGKLQSTLRSGAWAHTLGFNFKTGYRDQEQTVEVLDTDGNVTGTEDIRLKIKTYYTFDWQTAWDLSRESTLTLGVLNIFDRNPPFSLVTGGTNKGQQFGYDDRYYDPRGRTLYANFRYKF